MLLRVFSSIDILYSTNFVFLVFTTTIVSFCAAVYVAHYQPLLPRIKMPLKITDKVLNWCTSNESVSSLLAEDPSLSPQKAIEKLLGHEKLSMGEKHNGKKAASSAGDGSHHGNLHLHHPSSYVPPTAEDLERARKCGNFGDTKPSELFLKLWHDTLLTLEQDPLVGCVSPSLMGSIGVMPLSIIAPGWDITGHMSNLIARAEKEVFLATNYWIASGAATLITNALKELSRRAGERKEKVVVKILYDRGSLSQFLNNHYPVTVSDYTGKKIAIPPPEELPNIDLQIVNYHRPALGTFHAKFLVVDRKYGVLSSNNIQDNDNLEMMTHFEGPIVDALYDLALISWYNPLEPPLPLLSTPAATTGYPTFDEQSFKSLFDAEGNLAIPEHHPLDLSNGTTTNEAPERLPPLTPEDPHYDSSIAEQYNRIQTSLAHSKEESHISRVNKHLNAPTKCKLAPSVPEPEPDNFMTPYIPHPPHAPVPMALIGRKPTGAPHNSFVNVPQNAAWLSALRNAERSVFIQTPDLNAVALVPDIVDAVKRGVEVTYFVCLGYNDAGELLPGQGGTNEMISDKLHNMLRNEGDSVKGKLIVGWYVGKDQNRVIHKKEAGRCCHVKVMIVDGKVGIQGSGNQDTQSWCHSQEVNVMVDSEIICKSWMDALKRNQNTFLYGVGSAEDGLWRDAEGNQAKEAIGKDPGRFSWAKGMVGAVERVRGVGGF